MPNKQHKNGAFFTELQNLHKGFKMINVRECKFHANFTFGNKSSWDRGWKFYPWNFRSEKRKFLASKVPWITKSNCNNSNKETHCKLHLRMYFKAFVQVPISKYQFIYIYIYIYIYIAPKSQKRIRARWRGALEGMISRLKIISLKMMSERGECLSLTDM